MRKCESNVTIFAGMPGKCLDMLKSRHAHVGYWDRFTFSNEGMSGYGKIEVFQQPRLIGCMGNVPFPCRLDGVVENPTF